MGFIKIHRNIREWGWYDDANTLAVWVHLLIDANFEEKMWHGETVGIGSLITSTARLAEQTGLSVKQIRICLCRLVYEGKIATKGASKWTKITICNYESYMIDGEDAGQAEGEQRASKGQAEGEQRATPKEDKNARRQEKKPSNDGKESPKRGEKKYSPEVEALYAMYPSKCPMRDAETGRRPFCKEIIARLLKERSFDDLKANMQRYLDENYGKHYLQNFSTFLHQFPDYSEGQGVLFREKKWKVAGERYTKEDVNRLVTDQNEFLSIPPAIRMALHDGKEVMWDGERFTIVG